MDNLPIPQSRIENLMNAFISRDSSRISAPQSRVEEFWYHLIEGTNSLPIPQSRIELLLKKIIENDTEQIPLAQSRAEEFLVSILTGDINKLPIPQSRSEYYLDYIARNNLVLDDIEYLKYNGTNITATNTVQKPFKSAILMGNTLVNCIKTIGYATTTWPTINLENVLIQPNKKYIAILEYLPTDCQWAITNRGGGSTHAPYSKNLYTIFTSASTVTDALTIHINKEAETVLTLEELQKVQPMIFEYQDGMENWDIPYFEGMQSVKIPVLTTSNEDGTKTNILTVNEDVTLRGIGDVRDTLDCLIGEVTERIGEIVLDGVSEVVDGERWSTNTDLDTNVLKFFYITNKKINGLPVKVDGSLINDKFISEKTSNRENIRKTNTECLIGGDKTQGMIQVFIKKDRLTEISVNGFRQWLSQNPITVQYQLETESIKTVDLKVVDQDGNPVNQLSAFDSTTHIISDSESDNSLIAIAEVEVPTKLIEALNAVKSLSSDVEMLINEVDNAQKLQDENSTMVMSAMTELYEMVLVMGGGS